ncbi:MAG: hypothetical protein ACYC6Y_05755 [Thermoguttaceae bacterium]
MARSRGSLVRVREWSRLGEPGYADGRAGGRNELPLELKWPAPDGRWCVLENGPGSESRATEELVTQGDGSARVASALG